MWTREELKSKAKVSFKANYWRAVLVALILLVLVGGASGVIRPSFNMPIMLGGAALPSTQSTGNVNVEVEDGRVRVDVDGDDGKVHVRTDRDDSRDFDKTHEGVPDKVDVRSSDVSWPGVVLVSLTMMLMMLIVLAFVIALYVLVFSPLEVGAQRFFVRNLNQPTEVKEVAFAYDNNYKETVKTMFFRWLFTFLWSLLFIIPGIYKAYEYRMIPYLLAEDPAMTKDRAFAESKRMMDGQKWNAFVLDLSFLGWNILSAMTMGILGVFYVGPYQAQTNAALYEKLRYGLPAPGQAAAQPAPYAPVGAPGMQAAPVVVPASQPPVPPFAQVGAQPAAAPVATAPAPAAVGTAPAPAADAPAPAAGAPAAPASTAPMSGNDLAPTAPIPEAGVDPAEQMPGIGENNSAPDSTEA